MREAIGMEEIDRETFDAELEAFSKSQSFSMRGTKDSSFSYDEDSNFPKPIMSMTEQYLHKRGNLFVSAKPKVNKKKRKIAKMSKRKNRK